MSVMSFAEGSAAEQSTPGFLMQPGTTASPATPRLVPTRNFVIPLIAGVTMMLGTVAAVTPADAAAYHERIAMSSTRTGELVDESAADQDQMVAALQSLRLMSGLTWGETAMALGVSRRAVHHWTAGARMSARHAQRFRSLVELVAVHDAGDAERTRGRLIAPDAQGRSVLGVFAAAYRAARPTPLSTQSLKDILEAANDERAEAPRATASRPSALGARRLRAEGMRDS